MNNQTILLLVAGAALVWYLMSKPKAPTDSKMSTDEISTGTSTGTQGTTGRTSTTSPTGTNTGRTPTEMTTSQTGWRNTSTAEGAALVAASAGLPQLPAVPATGVAPVHVDGALDVITKPLEPEPEPDLKQVF